MARPDTLDRVSRTPLGIAEGIGTETRYMGFLRRFYAADAGELTSDRQKAIRRRDDCEAGAIWLDMKFGNIERLKHIIDKPELFLFIPAVRKRIDDAIATLRYEKRDLVDKLDGKEDTSYKVDLHKIDGLLILHFD